jgi:hypothetical protein
MSNVPPVKSDRPGDGQERPSAGPTVDPRLAIPEVLQRPVHVPGVTDKPRKTPMLASLAGGSPELAMGFDFIASVAGAGLLGWGIDWMAGSFPLWLLVGIGIGFVFATVRIIRRTAIRPGSGEGGGKGRGRGVPPKNT